MKNIFLPILLLIFSTISLSAQSNFGIRAGLNYSSQSFDNTTDDLLDDKGSVIGYHVGFNYEFAPNEVFAVRPGLLYSVKGSKFTTLGSDVNFKMNYLEVPLEFIFDIGFIDVFAGPYLSYALGGSIDVNDVSQDFDFDENDRKRTDYGFNIGANIDINDQFYVGAIYQFGLGNISEDELRDDDSIKNKMLSLFVTFRF